MESIIYVAEATALIESIHILKQWLYDGTIQLLIPTCTFHIVEEAYKASLIAKDAPKQQPQAKHTGGRTRKECPLFDINPRTTWEFIERVKSEKKFMGVIFQQENEIFTQWNHEDQKKVAKEEEPLPPPSSFADALLRKLVVKEDTKGTKAPGKPKLTARTKDHKPVWKIEKTPTLSASGLTGNNKSLLSCILWRVYEAEKNPLKPVKYQLLVNDQHVKDMAHEFGLIAVTMDSLMTERARALQSNDVRNVKGQLEQVFPEILELSRAFVSGNDIDSNSGDFGFLDPKQSNGELDHHTDHTDLAELKEAEGNMANLSSGIELDRAIPKDETSKSEDDFESKIYSPSTVSATTGQIYNILQNIGQAAPSATSPGKVDSPDKEIKQEAQFDSDLESDEEIIVFNPRNRRGSGPMSSRSRPGSSGSFVTKIYKAGIATSSSLVFPATPTSVDGQTAVQDVGGETTIPDSPMQPFNHSNLVTPASTLPIKSPVESKLKAESPVFTPGKLILPSPTGPSASAVSTLHSNPDSPLPPTGPRNTGPRHQRGGIVPKSDNHEFVRMQKESSHRMIQRQREAIQRQSKAADGNSIAQSPSSPRLIQMEPTDNPTVIDPDAFDRTYIVQPPTTATNVIQRGAVQRRRGRGHHRGLGKDRSKQNGQATESSVDSTPGPDSPRVSTRGKGRLWIP